MLTTNELKKVSVSLIETRENKKYLNLYHNNVFASNNGGGSIKSVNSIYEYDSKDLIILCNETKLKGSSESCEKIIYNSINHNDTIAVNEDINYSLFTYGEFWRQKIITESSSKYAGLRKTESDSSQPLENNDVSFEDYLSQKITPKFLSIIKDEYFEFGYTSKSEELVRDQLSLNALAARNWLNEIFITYYSKESVLIGLLRIISRFEPSLIYPQGQTMALAALSHRSNEVKELGVRAFEQWCDNESVNILKSIDKKIPLWLLEYVNDVIRDIEEQLCL